MQQGNTLKSLVPYIISEAKYVIQGHNFHYETKHILRLGCEMLIQNVCWISGLILQWQVNWLCFSLFLNKTNSILSLNFHSSICFNFQDLFLILWKFPSSVSFPWMHYYLISLRIQMMVHRILCSELFWFPWNLFLFIMFSLLDLVFFFQLSSHPCFPFLFTNKALWLSGHGWGLPTGEGTSIWA